MAFGYLPNRSSTGILKNRPLLIGLGKTTRSTIFRIKETKSGSLPCPHEQNPHARENGFNWQRQILMMRAYRNWRRKLPKLSAKRGAGTHLDQTNQSRP